MPGPALPRHRSWPQALHVDRARAFALAIFAALAVASTGTLWSAAGWPENHEGIMFALRTHVYARHLSWGDLAPIWSSADADGFGSPMPLLYHKLFYLLAAPLALGTGSVDAAGTVLVILFLIAGAAGMYGLTRACGGDSVSGVVAGVALITANYTITNWLVRGAVAEFSGAMLMPWLLLFFVRSLQGGRWRPALGATLALLWLAHSAVAYVTALLLAVTYLLLAVTRQASWQLLDPRRSWRAGVLFLAPVVPYLVPMLVIAPEYEVRRILTEPYRPEYQFRDLALYFRDPLWEWGHMWEGFTTRLDVPMTVGLVVASVLLVVRRRAAARSDFALALPLLIPASLALLLQARSALWFYTAVPGAEFLQFPWRLLALITPALIAVTAALLSRALPAAAGRVALVTLAIAMVASSGAFRPLQYARITLPAGIDGATFSAFREYEPRAAPPTGELRTAIAAAWTQAGCRVAAQDRAAAEVRRIRYDVTCAGPADLPLPIFASPFHRVQIGAGSARACLALRDFPTVCGVRVGGGESRLTVALPSLLTVARHAWRVPTPP